MAKVTGRDTGAPECGNRDYMLRGRKKIDADADKKAAPKTKYQCQACGHAWRGQAGEGGGELAQAAASKVLARQELAMSLIACSACGHRISVEAEACPQCGHPNRASRPEADAPKCYACSATATIRCQSCGVLSCARHLQSIYVTHGRGGAYELRCKDCYSFAVTWTVVSGVIVAVVVLAILLLIFARM